MQTVLSGRDRPTAVFCASDAAGLQLCGLAQELGLRVPRDLSLISYDGTSLTEVATPPLTAVYADRARAGRRAAETLIARIDGSVSGAPREIITPVSLRVRCSTGPPAKE
jgi:DNA-binding LacI/PurR family transcriptional regulator